MPPVHSRLTPRNPVLIRIFCPCRRPAAVKKFWVEYGHKMVSKLRGLPSRHGAFVTNCAAHCQSGAQAAWHAGMESAWVNRTIEGVSIQAVRPQRTGGDSFVPQHPDNDDNEPPCLMPRGC